MSHKNIKKLTTMKIIIMNMTIIHITKVNYHERQTNAYAYNRTNQLASIMHVSTMTIK